MITVFGEGSGFRVVLLLGSMGPSYRLRRVDLPAACYFTAFVIGSDGHNIEVVCHEPSA